MRGDFISRKAEKSLFEDLFLGILGLNLYYMFYESIEQAISYTIVVFFQGLVHPKNKVLSFTNPHIILNP